MSRIEKKKEWPKENSAKKVGQANAGPAILATTALAPFPLGDHRAARHIQANMSKTNTNKEVPPRNGQ